MSVLTLAIVNVVDILLPQKCCDFIFSLGFPMPFLRVGGYGGIRQFLWPGALVDLIAPVILACFISWVWKRFLNEKSLISAPK